MAARNPFETLADRIINAESPVARRQIIAALTQEEKNYLQTGREPPPLFQIIEQCSDPQVHALLPERMHNNLVHFLFIRACNTNDTALQEALLHTIFKIDSSYFVKPLEITIPQKHLPHLPYPLPIEKYPSLIHAVLGHLGPTCFFSVIKDFENMGPLDPKIFKDIAYLADSKGDFFLALLAHDHEARERFLDILSKFKLGLEGWIALLNESVDHAKEYKAPRNMLSTAPDSKNRDRLIAALGIVNLNLYYSNEFKSEAKEENLEQINKLFMKISNPSFLSPIDNLFIGLHLAGLKERDDSNLDFKNRWHNHLEAAALKDNTEALRMMILLIFKEPDSLKQFQRDFPLDTLENRRLALERCQQEIQIQNAVQFLTNYKPDSYEPHFQHRKKIAERFLKLIQLYDKPNEKIMIIDALKQWPSYDSNTKLEFWEFPPADPLGRDAKILSLVQGDIDDINLLKKEIDGISTDFNFVDDFAEFVSPPEIKRNSDEELLAIIRNKFSTIWDMPEEPLDEYHPSFFKNTPAALTYLKEFHDLIFSPSALDTDIIQKIMQALNTINYTEVPDAFKNDLANWKRIINVFNEIKEVIRMGFDPNEVKNEDKLKPR